jgi:hypothetical protein
VLSRPVCESRTGQASGQREQVYRLSRSRSERQSAPRFSRVLHPGKSRGTSACRSPLSGKSSARANSGTGTRGASGGDFVPANMDVSETENEVRICAELPGSSLWWYRVKYRGLGLRRDHAAAPRHRGSRLLLRGVGTRTQHHLRMHHLNLEVIASGTFRQVVGGISEALRRCGTHMYV